MKVRISFLILLLTCFSIPSYSRGFEGDYESIDVHALHVPSSVENSVESLADYLSKPARNEKEKARAIYRWITQNIAYDTEAYFAGGSRDLNPRNTLESRQAVCDGYSELFVRLGKAAGFEVKKVSGYSKGYAYLTSGKISDTPDHAWNAIKLDGTWHLVDSTWGAGYLDDEGNFVRRFNSFYFLTDPEHLIFDHLPENPDWQLLENPISSEDYQGLVYLRPDFFANGLQIESHKEALIKALDQVTVELKSPDNTLLSAVLIQAGNRLDENYTFVQKRDAIHEVSASFPESGRYTLRIFVKQKGDDGSYRWALDYKLEATTQAKKIKRFPLFFEKFQTEAVSLYAPLFQELESGTTQNFRLRVPNAEKVAVVIGRDGNWNYLEKRGDMFVGDVFIDRKVAVEVYAIFPGNYRLDGLLKYVGI